MSKLITVFGATGNQGSSVIQAVLADPVLSKEFRIRGVTRDTTKEAAKELASKGVEFVTVSTVQYFGKQTPNSRCRQICHLSSLSPMQ